MSNDYDDLLELGNFYILSQEFEEAIKILKKAEKLEKRDAKLFYSLGIAYEGLSDRDNARDAFRSALTLNPDHKQAQEHLDRLIEE